LLPTFLRHMKKNSKVETFVQDYGSNFQPSWLEKMIIKHELPRQKVIEKFLPSSGQVLVDLACGDGQFLAKQKTQFKTLIGFDISEVRIKKAKQLLKEASHRAVLKVVDLDEGIPLDDKTADVVVCEASLSCFIRPDKVIEEVHRVLKKNGVFIVQIGNYAYLTRRLALLAGNLPKISSFKGFGDGGMLHHFTYASLKELLEEKKFKVTAQANSGVGAQLRKIWPELLAADIIYQAQKK
jgi:ubiquinone/menaquinone biosynthesis C-methylase UbiE